MRLWWFLSVVAWTCTLPATGQAQTLEGTVFDGVTGLPVSAAEVLLRTASGKRPHQTGLSDTTGRFTFRVDPGQYVLQTRRVGYLPAISRPIRISSDELIAVKLVIATEPIAVDAVVVTARTRWSNPYLKATGFYARQETGIGRFLTRGDLARSAGSQLSDALRRTASVHMVPVDGRRFDIAIGRSVKGRRCIPAVLIDGTIARPGGPPRTTDVAIDDMVSAADVEGVEIYSGVSQAPPQFSRHAADCGAIVLWTKRQN